jgi:hypothetical protein
MLAMQISGIGFYLACCFCFVLGYILCGIMTSGSDREDKEEAMRKEQDDLIEKNFNE